MAPPKRQSPILTTDYDIPIAISEPLPPPPSVRRSARIATSSRAPTLRGASRARTNTLTTAATTPARAPPRDSKGKGKEVARPQRAISVDPNLPPFRDPAYTAVSYSTSLISLMHAVVALTMRPHRSNRHPTHPSPSSSPSSACCKSQLTAGIRGGERG